MRKPTDFLYDTDDKRKAGSAEEGVFDTGAILASPKALPLRADGRFMEVGLSQSFLEYGLWQDYGTGRETPRKPRAEGELAHTSAEAQPGLRSRNPRGNSGDLGRAKKRQRRRWFSRKYYASVMRTKEFFEENLGREFCGVMSDFARRANFRTQSGKV